MHEIEVHAVKASTVKEYANAHDLRRAFGFRWSRLVMPTILRELMRHESIDTTLKYYVGLTAESTADELCREVEANCLVDSPRRQQLSPPQSGSPQQEKSTP